MVYIIVLLQWTSTELTGLDCLLFGSFISSTDPVSILSIFSSLGVDKDLYATVFGESVLNDAIAITLYRTLLVFEKKPFTTLAGFLAFLDFFKILFGSIGLSIGFGATSALVFKHTSLHKYPTSELILLTLFAFSSYLLAEGLLLSGIVTVLFCGIFMGHYTSHNLSPKAAAIAKKMFKIISSICETVVFTYLGLAVFSYDSSQQQFDIVLILFSIPIVVIARALNVFPMSTLVNCCRSKEKKN